MDVKSLEKYIKLIKEYSERMYKNMLREPSGMLKHKYIVPGSSCYNNQLWDWDSWLTDIAISQIIQDNSNDSYQFVEYEKGCILNFFENMLSDGRIPIMVSPSGAFPKMLGDDVSNIHKPCIIQHTAYIIKKTGESEWIIPYVGKMRAFIDYYMENFRHSKTGLYFWQDDFAIGVDNDPATFYRPPKSSASIFLNCLMYKEIDAMCYICSLLKVDNEKYKNEKENLYTAIQKQLWDERNGLFYSADLNLVPVSREKELHSGCPRHWECLIQRIDIWSVFLAMWAGIATEEQAKRMVCENMINKDMFSARYGIRTLSKLEKMYCVVKSNNPSCWLGPVWIISNYMCFRALLNYGYNKEALEIANKTIILLGKDIERCGEMHEYYDPDTGEGIENQGFQNWNLLVNNMIAWTEGRETIKEF